MKLLSKIAYDLRSFDTQWASMNAFHVVERDGLFDVMAYDENQDPPQVIEITTGLSRQDAQDIVTGLEF